MVDFGIGAYEYGGAKGVHHDYGEATICCEAELINGDMNVIRQSTHVARKDHKDGFIKKGDKYKVRIFRCWKKDGPSWVFQEKNIIKRADNGVLELNEKGII